jgi:hypothetical protein
MTPAANESPRGLNLDIDGWLRRVGLAQYAEMFRAAVARVIVMRPEQSKPRLASAHHHAGHTLTALL